ncbi:hypothetical protein CN265_05285 [Priestia megaterium]|nr:hypothetical protein CN265_05285 [Priestia megaterium]
MIKLKNYIIKPPPLAPGISFLMIFGGQFILGYMREDIFYTFHLTLGILGLFMIIASLLIKKKKQESKKSI